jgi:hypothetical protein
MEQSEVLALFMFLQVVTHSDEGMWNGFAETSTPFSGWTLPSGRFKSFFLFFSVYFILQFFLRHVVVKGATSFYFWKACFND